MSMIGQINADKYIIELFGGEKLGTRLEVVTIPLVSDWFISNKRLFVIGQS